MLTTNRVLLSALTCPSHGSLEGGNQEGLGGEDRAPRGGG